MFPQKWSDTYYAHNIGADEHSSQSQLWVKQLTECQPDIQQLVKRTVEQWNLIVRDQLRNETALRLSIESKINHPDHKTTQIPIKVVDGLPEPLIDILRHYQDQASLLLNENVFLGTTKGLEIATQQFAELQQLCASPVLKADLDKALAWFRRILDEIKRVDIKHQLREINQDILGAYFFHVPKVEIYWAAIGIYARLYDISIEGLSVVVLAHELAHAYTHRGKDIDGTSWETQHFGRADLEIVEGLAQFYTKTVCEKLASRIPAALEAYQALLQTQPPVYTQHERWIELHPRLKGQLKEAVRFSMIQCRSEGISQYGNFLNVLQRVGDFPFSR